GVVGLKPTWGRVPATGVWPLSWSCDHVGPIAATVADVALLDQVLAGETNDPVSGPPNREGSQPTEGGRSVVRSPGPGHPVHSPRPGSPRIGRVVGDDLGPVDPGVAGVLDELCQGLEAAGGGAGEGTLPLARAEGGAGARGVRRGGPPAAGGGGGGGGRDRARRGGRGPRRAAGRDRGGRLQPGHAGHDAERAGAPGPRVPARAAV